MRTLRSTALLASALALGVVLAPGTARAQPFTECPRVGGDASCGVLITFNPDGSVSITRDPTQGPYDGNDDALVGVLNNSGHAVSAFTLTTPNLDAFGFDNDGLCTFNITCTWAHATGYEGPNMRFANVSPDNTTGTIEFTNALADGATTYFSLENTPAAILAANPTGTVTPEPATIGLVAVGLGLAAAARRRRS